MVDCLYKNEPIKRERIKESEVKNNIALEDVLKKNNDNIARAYARGYLRYLEPLKRGEEPVIAKKNFVITDLAKEHRDFIMKVYK